MKVDKNQPCDGMPLRLRIAMELLAGGPGTTTPDSALRKADMLIRAHNNSCTPTPIPPLKVSKS